MINMINKINMKNSDYNSQTEVRMPKTFQGFSRKWPPCQYKLSVKFEKHTTNNLIG